LKSLIQSTALVYSFGNFSLGKGFVCGFGNSAYGFENKPENMAEPCPSAMGVVASDVTLGPSFPAHLE
jgi:hypothetical protein